MAALKAVHVSDVPSLDLVPENASPALRSNCVLAGEYYYFIICYYYYYFIFLLFLE